MTEEGHEDENYLEEYLFMGTYVFSGVYSRVNIIVPIFRGNCVFFRGTYFQGYKRITSVFFRGAFVFSGVGTWHEYQPWSVFSTGCSTSRHSSVPATC